MKTSLLPLGLPGKVCFPLVPRAVRAVGIALGLLFTAGPAGWLRAGTAPENILYEGFEGIWPAGNWSTGDYNPNGATAFWDDVWAGFGLKGAPGGGWKAYCAGYGYGGDESLPSYRDEMDAYMRVPIDLIGFASVRLTFSHWLSSEPDWDEARVFVDGTIVWSADGTLTNWEEVTVNLDAHVGAVRTLEFLFHSDGTIRYEGWYVDDISVTGVRLPANDSFDRAQTLSGISGTVNDDNTYASKQPGEPNHAGDAGGHSLWFRWMAPRAGPAWFGTTGSRFDTLLALYTGTNVSTLALVAANDDILENGSLVSRQSRTSFWATAATIYHVAVDGWNGRTGPVVLNWGYEPVLPAPPRLSVARLLDGRVRLSWPQEAEGVRLGSVANMPIPVPQPISWPPVNAPVTVLGEENVALLPIVQSAAFFRLEPEATPVPVPITVQISDAHARSVWSEPRLARGDPIPVSGGDGAPFAYILPYRRGFDTFPPTNVIREAIRALMAQFGPFPPEAPERLPKEFYAALEAALGPMGYVQVSATRANYPVLLAQGCLHPWFLNQDSARARASAVLGNTSVTLDGFFMTGPRDEYFAFSAAGRQIFIHARTLERITPDEFRALPRFSVPPELAAHRDQTWAEALSLGAGPSPGLHAASAGTHQYRRIADYDLVPIVDWTYWCVPTAFTMALGYYDHYDFGRKIQGYGRLIDYWREVEFEYRGENITNNVPNLIAEIVQTDLTNALNGPGWNRYAFILPTPIEGNAANDWAWPALVNEVDSNRPFVWSADPPDRTGGHSMTGLGYRIVGSQKFVVVYNTWGPTVGQQCAEYCYNQWAGGPASRIRVSPIRPGGGTGSDDGFLLGPRGGDVVSGASQIQWRVRGDSIRSTLLYDSIDGGRTWTLRANVATPAAGFYAHPWTPPAVTLKGRVRIQCVDLWGNLIAGDGSVENVAFGSHSDLVPDASAPGYCGRRNGQLVVVVSNRGTSAAPSSTTEVRFYNSSGPQTVQLSTPAIPAGASVEVLFDMPGACWNPDCDFEIRVDALNEVNEANENNNGATGACVG